MPDQVPSTRWASTTRSRSSPVLSRTWSRSSASGSKPMRLEHPDRRDGVDDDLDDGLGQAHLERGQQAVPGQRPADALAARLGVDDDAQATDVRRPAEQRQDARRSRGPASPVERDRRRPRAGVGSQRLDDAGREDVLGEAVVVGLGHAAEERLQRGDVSSAVSGRISIRRSPRRRSSVVARASAPCCRASQAKIFGSVVVAAALPITRPT